MASKRRKVRAEDLVAFDRDAVSLAYQEGYLRQLNRILRIRREHLEELNPYGFKIIDTCICAFFEECRSAGFVKQAQEELEKSGFNQRFTASVRTIN